MSNYYHGCKEETINLIPHYLISIIYKPVKASHLEKLQIIENINNLLFQILFIFSDWILIKQIIVFSTPFLLGKQIFKKFCLEFRVGYEYKCIDFNAFSRNVNTINLKIFPTHGGIYNIFNKYSGERWNPNEFKGIWKEVSLRLILKDKHGKQHCCSFCWF